MATINYGLIFPNTITFIVPSPLIPHIKCCYMIKASHNPWSTWDAAHQILIQGPWAGNIHPASHKGNNKGFKNRTADLWYTLYAVK